MRGVILETEKKNILVYSSGEYKPRTDTLAVESSLAVIVNGRPLYYCMRTPGMDRELAVGLCFNDGRIKSQADIKSIIQEDESTVRIDISAEGKSGCDEIKIIRSSAGVICNDSDSIHYMEEGKDHKQVTFSAGELFKFQDDFISRQKIYTETGATHAAGIYDARGSNLVYAEDVGRHNALDKCIGSLFVSGKLKEAVYCILSSRLSYEMVIKSARAGFRVVAGVSAPTSFAVELAESKGMTLIGYLRGQRFNVYSGEGRIIMGTA